HEQLAQSLSRAADPLGGESVQLSRAYIPCVRPHRAPTIILNFETRSKACDGRTSSYATSRCRVRSNAGRDTLARSRPLGTVRSLLMGGRLAIARPGPWWTGLDRQ